MKVNQLSILVTDDCNFKCKFCYQHSTLKQRIDPLLAKKIVQYALKNSGPELSLSFSGGEPLLEFSLMNKCLYYIKKKAEETNKKLSFSIITNGSLINDEILSFLEENHFSVQYSFHVYIKEDPHESENFKKGQKILRKLVRADNIALSTNTVFTPEIADKVFDSVKYLKEQGVTDIGIGIDQTSDWDQNAIETFKEELRKTKDLVISEYRRSGQIIVDYFDKEKRSGINRCGAAGDTLTITPDGSLWGCVSFHYLDWDNLKEDKENYYYGHVNDIENGEFEKKVEEVKSQYNELSTDSFRTDSSKCFLCDYLLECRICPAQKYTYLNGERSIFYVPEQVCEINKVMIDLNREFQKEISETVSN